MHLLKGTKHRKSLITKPSKKLKIIKHFDFDASLDSSNSESYGVSSPFTLPPFDSLAPNPLPENAPPNCLYPPNTPQPPSTTIPTPTGYTSSTPLPPFSYLPPILPTQSPPPSPTQSSSTPNPPETFPSPSSNIPAGSPTPALNPPIYAPGPLTPSPLTPTLNPPIYVPSPQTPALGPPSYVPGPPGPTLTPPYIEPNPPSNVPSPTGFIPSPVFLPPIVYPPPTVPRTPKTAPIKTLWCVAKPTVPDPIIEEAMNYACGSGADCASIQPNGSCFQPNTLFAHASYAFNSFWQRTRVAGGTCEFGGIAMLVSVDPSYDGCPLYLQCITES
ncbi:Glucan endo-1,3-beta-glucosidase-like protein 3 [Quillaja saponaria]|nr:Glucan endo-1,3-beta-glucosidase-like protein 3 [Quillaja saponaria]